MLQSRAQLSRCALQTVSLIDCKMRRKLSFLLVMDHGSVLISILSNINGRVCVSVCVLRE